jgi:hypothetical protein
MLLAHIAGIPVEETALSMAPVATVLGGAAFMQLRRGVSRRPSPARRGRPRGKDAAARQARR